MSKTAQIEIVAYEQERLSFFVDEMNRSKKRYDRLFKKHKDASYLSEEVERLEDAGRELQFHHDVVEMLEALGNEKNECDNTTKMHPVDEFICSECGAIFRDCSLTVIDEETEDERCLEFEFSYCPRCGKKVRANR